MRRVYVALVALLTVVLTVTSAIALPIFVRPFYYAHIDALDLPERTGYDREVIKDAYDEVLDYLVFGKSFGTGQLRYSQAGKSHFEDCRRLFKLDFWALGLSFGGLAVMYAVRKKLPRERGAHLPVFRSAVIALAAVGILGLWGAISFDSLFVAFHHAFFPGKTNWIFDPAADEIINILPQSFFLNCAALVGGLILAANIIFIVIDARNRKARAEDKQNKLKIKERQP